MTYYFAGPCTGECAKSLEPLSYVVLVVLLIIFIAFIAVFFVSRRFYKRYKLSHPGSLLSKKQKIVVIFIFLLITVPFVVNSWIDFQGQRLKKKRYSDEYACKVARYGEGAPELNQLIGGVCDFRDMPQYKGH